MDEKVKDIAAQKVIIKELDKRGGVRWGLATSLRYYQTINYIIDLLSLLSEKEGGMPVGRRGGRGFDV